MLAALWLASVPNYHLVQRTDFGEVFTAERQDAHAIGEAVTLTLNDAAAYFGQMPKAHAAYEDEKTHDAGGATFTVTTNGVAVKGLVSVKASAKGERVMVAFIRADAPREEWRKLLGGDANDSSANNGGTDSAVADTTGMRTYRFSDGSGTIMLAPGWTTNSPSCLRGVVVQGPGDQTLTISQMFSVLTPQSPLRRGPQTLVANWASPGEILQTLVPELSRLSVQQGGPERALDHVQKMREQKAMAPNGRAEFVSFGVSERAQSGEMRHYKAVALLEADPINATSFVLWATILRARDAALEHDLPLMYAMVNSLKTNQAMVAQKNAQAANAQKQWFAIQQAHYHAQQAANDAQHAHYWATQRANEAQHQQWQDQQNTRARKNDDFDEIIRGYRTVEDTQTGEKASVDLGNVDKIVDDLNERDPGRYRQIPLRDEVDPVR